MLKLLLVANANGPFSALRSFLEGAEEIQILQADTGDKALEVILNQSPQLMVTDETLSDMTGLELVEKVVKVNPMINTAVVSPLSKSRFHEASEGLGVLMQLPPEPGENEGRKLLQLLRHVLGLEEHLIGRRGDSAE